MAEPLVRQCLQGMRSRILQESNTRPSTWVEATLKALQSLDHAAAAAASVPSGSAQPELLPPQRIPVQEAAGL